MVPLVGADIVTIEQLFPFTVGAIPLALARVMGRLGSRRRTLAIAYIVIVFYGIPLLLLLVSGAFSGE